MQQLQWPVDKDDVNILLQAEAHVFLPRILLHFTFFTSLLLHTKESEIT